jgi:hypothetical protein
MPPKKSDDNDKIIKSKRGRPPIQKTPHVKSKKVVPVNNEEELVLHLPLFDDEPTDTKNIFTMRDSESSNDTFDDTTMTDIEKKTDINHLIDEINKRDAIIKSLKDNIKNFKNISQENILTITKETKKTLVNIGLINLNTNKQLQCVEKTIIACWHCCYNFDTAPLFLPEKYHNNNFYVFGNFCTWSCMLAYNNQIDEYRKQIRNSLIKKLYKDIYGVECLIKPAGQRECLERYGGPVKIEKFRDPKLNQTMTSKINIPPQIPLLSYYEETIIDNN